MVNEPSVFEPLKFYCCNNFYALFRLRHEKLKPVKVDRGGPSEYQMLRCDDLEETPTPKNPTLKINKDDPFNFSMLLAD